MTGENAYQLLHGAETVIRINNKYMSYRRTGAITSTLAPMASIASLRGVVRSVRGELLEAAPLRVVFALDLS